MFGLGGNWMRGQDGLHFCSNRGIWCGREIFM